MFLFAVDSLEVIVWDSVLVYKSGHSVSESEK